MSSKISRRQILRLGVIASAGVLVACAPKVVKETVIVEKPVEKVVEKPVEKVVKETVIVAGTPKVVEKVVKETVLVEAPPAKKVEEKIEIVGWGTRGFDPDVENLKPYADAVNAHVHDKYPGQPSREGPSCHSTALRMMNLTQPRNTL